MWAGRRGRRWWMLGEALLYDWCDVEGGWVFGIDVFRYVMGKK